MTDQDYFDILNIPEDACIQLGPLEADQAIAWSVLRARGYTRDEIMKAIRTEAK